MVALLLAGRSIGEVCEQVPISRTSLWRLRAKESFLRRFAEARKQAFERAVNALHDSALTFVSTLADVCQDPKARGSERASAARSGLDTLIRAREICDLETRLKALEEAVNRQ